MVQAPDSQPGRFADLSILLVMSTFVPLIAGSIRILGFEKSFYLTRRMTGTLKARPGTYDRPIEYLERLKRLTRWIKRKGLYRGNCLSRSVVLWVLLQRKGINCELKFGSRYKQGEFQAHAWVEHSGVPINASPNVNTNYSVFDFGSAKDVWPRVG